MTQPRLKVRLRDDPQIFDADNATELVGKLNNSSLQPCRTRQRWMKEAARRASLQTGKPIRYDTPRHFLNDLISAGIATIITPD